MGSSSPTFGVRIKKKIFELPPPSDGPWSVLTANKKGQLVTPDLNMDIPIGYVQPRPAKPPVKDRYVHIQLCDIVLSN